MWGVTNKYAHRLQKVCSFQNTQACKKCWLTTCFSRGAVTIFFARALLGDTFSMPSLRRSHHSQMTHPLCGMDTLNILKRHLLTCRVYSNHFRQRKIESQTQNFQQFSIVVVKYKLWRIPQLSTGNESSSFSRLFCALLACCNNEVEMNRSNSRLLTKQWIDWLLSSPPGVTTHHEMFGDISVFCPAWIS